MKLLNYALKVIRLCRALNRTPLAYESNTLPIRLYRYTAGGVIIELHNKRDRTLLTVPFIHCLCVIIWLQVINNNKQCVSNNNHCEVK